VIELSQVTIQAGDYLLENISFEIAFGEYVVLMGKTGIGKTTILEAICGLRSIRGGRISIGGVDVSRFAPGDRNVGYVPQDLALFPTLSVREHLEFALRLRRCPPRIMAQRVAELARVLEIEHLQDRRIRGLSGGESQRVALGRALSFGPSVLLLDEPLSALDAETRASTQDLLKAVNRQTRVSVLHVTHNREEATALADRCLTLQRDAESQTLSLMGSG
jgi:ABC-type sugar transport system ATPase subunit